MKINKKLTTKSSYVNRNNPKYIVVHETDNWSKGAGAKRHATAHANGNFTNGSSHYYVDDKSVWQALEHRHGSYSVGDGKGKYGITNFNSINIEICVNPDSNYDKARANAIELTKYLMRTTGIPVDRVVRHYDASRKRCPRRMIDDPDLWDDFKAQLGGKAVDNKTQSTKTWRNYINGPIVRELQHELNVQFNAGLKVDGWLGDKTIAALVNVRRGARGNLTRIIQRRLIALGYSVGRAGADGIFGNSTYNAVVKFQRAKGLVPDGIMGRETWKELFRK